MKTPIPNRLKEFRLKAGLRQIDVANKLQLNCVDRICRWEKGKTFPHMINLFKLSGLYHALPHELYGEKFLDIINELSYPQDSL